MKGKPDRDYMVQVGNLCGIVKCMVRAQKSGTVNKIIEEREGEGAVPCVC